MWLNRVTVLLFQENLTFEDVFYTKSWGQSTFMIYGFYVGSLFIFLSSFWLASYCGQGTFDVQSCQWERCHSWRSSHCVKESEVWGDGNLPYQYKTQQAFLTSSRNSVEYTHGSATHTLVCVHTYMHEHTHTNSEALSTSLLMAFWFVFTEASCHPVIWQTLGWA